MRSPSGWRQALCAAPASSTAARDAVVHLQESIGNDLRLLLAAARPRRGRFALTVHDPVHHPGDRTTRTGPPDRANCCAARAGLIFVHGEALRKS